ncbi:glycosyltransferase [Aliarcobacter skirrowii]|uniref:glycosyltransferase n=1 Tax=Aliarcobacter skirrowii TaxID=28200 RepID=UPI0021B41B13|nr:glycosyltransferase [Aliarcobacter skirrowii]MCT7447124.1 glycosyltransferase [Aliarcobacter skirrowii]
MKILLASNSLRGGGVESVLITLSNYLISQNHEVHLLNFNSFKEVDINPLLKRHVIEARKPNRISNLKKLISDLEKDTPFDLILSNQTETDHFMRELKNKNIYFVLHANFTQTYIIGKPILKKIRRIFRFRNRYKNLNIISVCNGVKDDFINNLKIKPASIKTIYNPIDSLYIERLSQEENIINEDNYIVHIANYSLLKRHDLIIKAYKLSNIKEKLVLIGTNVKENMLNLVKELDIEDKVIFTGFIKNPYPIIKNAKILVHSSDYEGFGMVLLESLSLKTLVVSTNYVYGANEILTDELSKYLVPTNNISALANKIKSTIDEIDNNSIRINFDKCIEKFRVNYIANQYLELI